MDYPSTRARDKPSSVRARLPTSPASHVRGAFSFLPAALSIVPTDDAATSTSSQSEQGSTSVSINNGIGSTTPTSGGSISVSPLVATTYTMTADGTGGNGTCNATVTVLSKPVVRTAEAILGRQNHELGRVSGRIPCSVSACRHVLRRVRGLYFLRRSAALELASRRSVSRRSVCHGSVYRAPDHRESGSEAA